MVRRSIKQFVKENYVLDFTVQGSCNGKYCADVPINVYRPRSMNPFTEHIKNEITEHIGCWEDNGGKGWWDHSPADRHFAAKTTVRYYPNKTDIYVCSIIRAPHTDEQGEYFESHGMLFGTDRLYIQWDSSLDSMEMRASIARRCKHLPDFDGFMWPYKPEEYPEIVDSLIHSFFSKKDKASFGGIDKKGLYIDVDREAYDRETWRSLNKTLTALNHHPLTTCLFTKFYLTNRFKKTNKISVQFKVK